MSIKNTNNTTAGEAVAPATDYDRALIADLSADPEFAEAYLTTALEEFNEEGGAAGLLIALRRVLEARGGLAAAAQKAGLARGSVYRALSENGNPTFSTLSQLAAVAGVQFTFKKCTAPR